MDPAETVNDWLNEIGRRAGMPDLGLDENGVCAVKYEGLTLVIEVPENSPSVYLYAPLLPIPDDDPQALYEKLLDLNFCCLETDGATFAIDPQDRQICLSYALPMSRLDSMALENTIGNLLQTARAWQDRFASSTESPRVPDGNAKPFLANTDLRA